MELAISGATGSGLILPILIKRVLAKMRGGPPTSFCNP